MSVGRQGQHREITNKVGETAGRETAAKTNQYARPTPTYPVGATAAATTIVITATAAATAAGKPEQHEQQ